MKTSLLFALALSPLTSASPVLRIRQDGNAEDGYNPKEDTLEMRMSSQCSQNQRNVIVNSIAESGYLAYALNQWGSNPLYDQDMEKFMGSGIQGDIKERLENNIRRAYEIHTGQVDTNVFIHCGDDHGQMMFRDCQVGVDAYTWDEGDAHHVVLCDNYWNYPSLGEKLEAVFQNPSTAHDVSSLYGNTGSIWFHETNHWGQTVSRPRVLDYDPRFGRQNTVYGPSQVEDNAKTNGAESNSMIADAYSVVSMAALLTQIFEIEEALDAGNATGSGMDTAEPSTMRKDYISRRQDQSENWVTVSASQAQIDTSKYTAETSESPVNDKPTQSNPKTGEDRPSSTSTKEITKATDNVEPSNDPKPPTVNDDQGEDGDSNCDAEGEWMAVDDFTNNGKQFAGYKSAVKEFCERTDGIVLDEGGKTYLAMVLDVGLTKGGTPREQGESGYLYLEVHNSKSGVPLRIETNKCYRSFTTSEFLEGQGGCNGESKGITKGAMHEGGKGGLTYGAMGDSKLPTGVKVGQRILSTESFPSKMSGKGSGSAGRSD